MIIKEIVLLRSFIKISQVLNECGIYGFRAMS